jgi:hypothetical protein
MAYTATSTYEYITGDELEAFARKDYSAIDSTNYTEANVMAQVTAAEEIVNSICGQSFTGTIPDGVKVATKLIARQLMLNVLYEDGWLTDPPHSTNFYDETVRQALHSHHYDPVDSVPAQGIDV